VYLLWAYQQVMHGPPAAKHPERLVEISGREWLAFAPLVALIFAVGVRPQPLLDRSQAAVAAALSRLERAAAVRVHDARTPPPSRGHSR
jgi:NADH:ubiquinone oxidoreductase subunit 4 (subunit M)